MNDMAHLGCSNRAPPLAWTSDAAELMRQYRDAVRNGKRLPSEGKTALIDPFGRLVWSLPEGEATSGIAEVAWLEPVTIFTRHGSPQALLGACALVIAASLLRSWRRRAAV
jgi:apolipoprotein N-acyltransferase